MCSPLSCLRSLQQLVSAIEGVAAGAGLSGLGRHRGDRDHPPRRLTTTAMAGITTTATGPPTAPAGTTTAPTGTTGATGGGCVANTPYGR